MNSQTHNNLLLKFGPKYRTATKEIIYGKSLLLSLITVFMLILLLSMFFFLIPFKVTLFLCIFRLFIFLVIVFVCYFFAKTVIEINIEGDKFNVKTFKRYKYYSIDAVQSISIYSFISGGYATMFLKHNNKSNIYFFWAPNFEKERSETFFKFVSYLKDASAGRFQLQFKE